MRISSRLKAQYPTEMTVVLQHQFWDLTVSNSAFEVGLSFKGVPEKLLVPFRAINSFVDPHASFGLKFDPQPKSALAEEQAAAPAEAAPEPVGTDRPAAPERGASAVVSLDAFRKRAAELRPLSAASTPRTRRRFPGRAQ